MTLKISGWYSVHPRHPFGIKWITLGWTARQPVNLTHTVQDIAISIPFGPFRLGIAEAEGHILLSAKLNGIAIASQDFGVLPARFRASKGDFAFDIMAENV